MSITGAQVKAARKLLGWPRAQFAHKSQISGPTVLKFENAKGRVEALTMSMLRRALEAVGIEFVDGEPGVTLNKSRPGHT